MTLGVPMTKEERTQKMKTLTEEFPGIPEYIHLRNPDGEITTKHIFDATPQELKQFFQQMEFEANLLATRAKEFVRLAEQEERGEVATGTAIQYFRTVTNPIEKFTLLYGDWISTKRK